MLPNFLIIGAEKAATTWLARCLAEHPSVYMPHAKEIYYFSSRFDRGLWWYAGYFRDWSGEKRIGEATPVYLSHPEAPARIRETLEDVKLIVSLRHPVDRAYSAYWHNLRRGRIKADSDFQKCFQDDLWEIRSRGNYLHHLGRYLDCFPRERMLFLLYDDIQRHPRGAYDDCLEFLELEPHTAVALNFRLNEGGRDLPRFNSALRQLRSVLRRAALWAIQRGVVPAHRAQRVIPRAQRAFQRLGYGWGPRARQYEPLPEEVRDKLMDEYYRDQLEPLEQMLEIDLSRWRQGRAATAKDPFQSSP